MMDFWFVNTAVVYNTKKLKGICLYLFVLNKEFASLKSLFCKYYLFLLVLLSTPGIGYMQTPISGVINRYAAVVSIDGNDRLTLDNAADFNTGDTVLVIQMKGAEIVNLPATDGNSGNIQAMHTAGKYEFIIVQGKTGNQLIFTTDLTNAYDVIGKVQVVRVPGYNKARVISDLMADPWNPVTGKGGVISLIVGNTLYLDASIDATGAGFRGGQVAGTTDECSETDAGYEKFFFSAAYDSAGNKGEGFITYRTPTKSFIIGSERAKGKGYIANGGGGGNARLSGGGGGGNYDKGGSGGNQYEGCTGGGTFGKGGIGISAQNFIAERQIFMGGGGGGGTQISPGAGTGGGSGGGIVIIMANTIEGNNVAIRSQGQHITQEATLDGSGGGGGAGGSLILDISEYIGTNISLDVAGGKGGDVALQSPSTGPGGGGGGGIIWHSDATLPGNLVTNVLGGSPGECITGMGQANGNDGALIGGLNLALTGFLFNSIKISASNDLIDTICEGDIPSQINGTDPRGGLLPYTYTWEWSTDLISWNPIAGANGIDYTPVTPRIVTTYYRRTVKDAAGANQITDISKPVKFVVQPKIINNVIRIDADSDTLCQNQAPAIIDSPFAEPSGGNGPGTYHYLWQESPDQMTWNTIAGAVSPTWQSPALTATTYFRRIVSSGIGCPDTSNVIKVTVLPLITNNLIGTDQVICEGSAFESLTGSNPAGGETGNYRFKWLESADGTVWMDAYGSNTDLTYDPDTVSVKFPSQTPVRFRRVVYSGALDVCRDTSGTVMLTQWPAISNNLFITDQVLCLGSVPEPVTGYLPTGGNNIYNYQWQDSIPGGTWQNRPGEVNKDLSFTIPPADSTFLRRVVTSDVCTDISPVDTISVQSVLQNVNIRLLSGLVDTTVCFGQVPNSIVSEPPAITGGNGIYNYVWESSTDGGSSWVVTGGNTVSLDPPALNQTTQYRRNVSSGQCTALSNTVNINVLPAISGNTVPASHSICMESSTILDGSVPAGGSGTYTYLWESSADNSTWVAAAGSSNQEDYNTPAITSTVYYRRTVTSGPAGCCQDISPSTRIDVYPLPTGIIADPNATVCSGTVVNLGITLTGAAPWDVVISDGTNEITADDIGSSPHSQPVTPTTTEPSAPVQYVLQAITDENGCQAKASGMTGQANITVYGVPAANAGPDEEVCGLTYTLKAVPGSFGSGSWTFPTAVADVSDNSNPNKQVEVNDQGNYNFIWTVTNGPCTLSDDMNIGFWNPVSAITLTPDTILMPYTDNVQLQAHVTDPVTGTLMWTAEPGSPVTFTPPDAASTLVEQLTPGEQMLYLTITNGACQEVYAVEIIVPVSVGGPKGLSPNNDGMNDYLRIYVPRDKSNELIIMNRWGTVVYKVKNFMVDDDQGWDGRDSNGDVLPDDTYYYILNVSGLKTFTGYIIIRGGQR